MGYGAYFVQENLTVSNEIRSDAEERTEQIELIHTKET